VQTPEDNSFSRDHAPLRGQSAGCFETAKRFLTLTKTLSRCDDLISFVLKQHAPELPRTLTLVTSTFNQSTHFPYCISLAASKFRRSITNSDSAVLRLVYASKVRPGANLPLFAFQKNYVIAALPFVTRWLTLSFEAMGELGSRKGVRASYRRKARLLFTYCWYEMYASLKEASTLVSVAVIPYKVHVQKFR